MTMFFWLLACERDPTLIGYWDIVAMRAGPSLDALEEVRRAGFLEFQRDGTTYRMTSYIWRDAWLPDPQPELQRIDSDVSESSDFVEGYVTEGETFSVSMYDGGSGAPASTYAIVDWLGSSVTLASTDAAPPGADQGLRAAVEYDLQR